MTQKKPNKCRNLMYAQQLSHLPCKTIDELEQRIQALAPEKYALIIHDRDTTEDGQPVEDHVHVMMCFKNARSANSVAKALGDKSQYVEYYDKREGNGFAYLVHRTDRAKDKYQYDVSEVRANFDYSAYMQELENKVLSATKHNQTKLLLDAFKAGHITKKELEERLTGSEIGRLKVQIDNIQRVLLQQEAEKWRKEALEQGRFVKVIWLWGEAGVGKSSFAKDYARKQGQSTYVSGSSRDLFAKYELQHTIILDDVRAGRINYEDLLRILDPYSIESRTPAPSRYFDKLLCADLFLISSPYNPYQFYKRSVSSDDSYYDTFEQLNRRITLNIYMDMDYIYMAKFDNKTEKYVLDENSKQKNNYSSKARPKKQGNNPEDLFKQIFE